MVLPRTRDNLSVFSKGLIVVQILLVDDDNNVVLGLTRMLRVLEPTWQVVTANNSAQALNKVRQLEISAIVADVHMPGGDGLELLRELRGRERYRSLPIVLLTGSVDLPIYDKAFELGATEVLTKPCDTDVLITKLRAHLSPATC